MIKLELKGNLNYDEETKEVKEFGGLKIQSDFSAYSKEDQVQGASAEIRMTLFAMVTQALLEICNRTNRSPSQVGRELCAWVGCEEKDVLEFMDLYGKMLHAEQGKTRKNK